VGRQPKLTDIKPGSEFRDNATELDVTECERMVEETELLSDVRTALQQIEAGRAVSNHDAKAELRRRFSTT